MCPHLDVYLHIFYILKFPLLSRHGEGMGLIEVADEKAPASPTRQVD